MLAAWQPLDATSRPYLFHNISYTLTSIPLNLRYSFLQHRASENLLEINTKNIYRKTTSSKFVPFIFYLNTGREIYVDRILGTEYSWASLTVLLFGSTKYFLTTRGLNVCFIFQPSGGRYCVAPPINEKNWNSVLILVVVSSGRYKVWLFCFRRDKYTPLLLCWKYVCRLT